jgi:hypothetical protein
LRAYRVDKNQKDIVNWLRKHGYSVQHLHSVGAGCPDILVGAEGVNILIEIKDSDGKLTPDQVVWHATWRGQVQVARTPEEAMTIVKNAIEQKTEKKAKKGRILVTHNDTPQPRSGDSVTTSSSCGTDEVSGGNSNRGKLAHISSEAERGAGGVNAKPWTRDSKNKGRLGRAFKSSPEEPEDGEVVIIRK